ncbi:MAG TPA: GAF domain-containing protein, partial [Nitrospiraceae bacterium]|nr:GAF domain-containing protein [Nitrospiraceae bacterium]
MGHAAEQARASKQTTLQKTLTTALNELGVDAALAAIFDREDGPLVEQVSRGFSPREVQAILAALSAQEVGVPQVPAGDGEPFKAIRLRLITPSAKSLLAIPLQYRQRTYGVLVIARKESAAFVKKEKTLIESAGEDITKALEREFLFDSTVLLSRPFVAQEPAISGSTSPEQFASPPSHASPQREAEITTVLSEAAQIMPFDRAWVTYYDPLAGAVEVLGIAGEKGEHKKDLKPGQRLALDASASGWAVRHRKPRVDHDLASTQGRFQDHKHLYKDRFRSAMVVPFFVRG